MDYESFKEKFVEDLKDRLDEQGADVKVSVNTVNKLNESYEAVTVTPEGSNIGVNIGIDKFYDAMENGRSYDEVVDVTAAWSKNRVDAEDQARKYCGELVKAGYLPLCPVLAFSGIISEDDPDGEKKRREMSEDLLKRARFLVVCGKKINDDVRADISVAKHSKVIPTTLEGVLECGD